MTISGDKKSQVIRHVSDKTGSNAGNMLKILISKRLFHPCVLSLKAEVPHFSQLITCYDIIFNVGVR